MDSCSWEGEGVDVTAGLTNALGVAFFGGFAGNEGFFAGRGGGTALFLFLFPLSAVNVWVMVSASSICIIQICVRASRN